MTEKARGLLDDLFVSAAMARIFSERAQVQALLDFEAALAEAEARVGIVPREAVAPIEAACRAELFDFQLLAEGAARSGNLAIPLVQALTEQVKRTDPAAARFVHFGVTSQDALDTALVLQLRAALGNFEVELSRLSAALRALAERHRGAIMLGRTWLKPAPPVTFGLKMAGFLSAIERHRQRLTEARPRLLVLQLGGAVGTLAALGAEGLSVARELSKGLELELPDLPWHAQRDRVAEAGSLLGLLTGTLGKLGRDLALLMQPEVAEVFEPRGPGHAGSSTMPHKHNPLGCAVMLAAATRVPPLVTSLLSAMPQEHERGLGGWQAEWETLPEICRLTSGALAHAIEAVEGLEIDAASMQDNLDATLGFVLAEPVALLLARHLGRTEAHALLEQVCARAAQQGLPLREALAREPAVTAHLSAAELDQACDAAAYLGQADTWIERVLTAAGYRPKGPR